MTASEILFTPTHTARHSAWMQEDVIDTFAERSSAGAFPAARPLLTMPPNRSASIFLECSPPFDRFTASYICETEPQSLGCCENFRIPVRWRLPKLLAGPALLILKSTSGQPGYGKSVLRKSAFCCISSFSGWAQLFIFRLSFLRIGQFSRFTTQFMSAPGWFALAGFFGWNRDIAAGNRIIFVPWRGWPAKAVRRNNRSGLAIAPEIVLTLTRSMRTLLDGGRLPGCELGFQFGNPGF
jgi:hypothetical protein